MADDIVKLDVGVKPEASVSGAVCLQTETSVHALHWPEGHPPRQSVALSITLWALMIGGVVGAFVHSYWWALLPVAVWLALTIFVGDLGRSTREGISEQLQARTAFPAEAWESADRAAIAELAGRAIADEIGWPNPNFLPSDPLQIVFFCIDGDGAEGLVILWKLEEQTNHPWHFGEVKTFGEFIDMNSPQTSNV